MKVVLPARPASPRVDVSPPNASRLGAPERLEALIADGVLPPAIAAPASGEQNVFARRLARLQQGLDRAPPVPEIAGEAPRSGVDVAIYAAHPDDEAMYGGGTMAALVKAGRTVDLCLISRGEGGRVLETRDGERIERRDLPEAAVVRLREVEVERAAGTADVRPTYLFPARARLDYGWTTSVPGTLEHWHEHVPGGLAAVLERLVIDLRTRRPRVVMTLDPRDDPHGSQHGHHRALGTLIDLACRLAADPSVPGFPPHAVEELVTFSPKGSTPDIALHVGNEGRLRMLDEYRTQFLPEDLQSELAQRQVEEFALAWRAKGVQLGQAGSVLASMLEA